jgi:DnaJ-class molecular chaperone
MTETEGLRKALERAKELNRQREQKGPTLPERIPCGHCGGRVSLLGKTCPECGGKGFREITAPLSD